MSVVSVVCNDRFFFLVIYERHLDSERGCSALGYFRGEKCCSFSIMVFLQMGSLNSLVVWHATSLKTDRYAFLCILVAFIPLYSRSVTHETWFCLGQVTFTTHF